MDEYNKRFNKVYDKVPAYIKPSQATAKLTYAGSFESDFAMMLRERKSTTLLIMQEDEIDLEGNIIAYRNIKPRPEKGEQEHDKEKCSKNVKEEIDTTGNNKNSQEAKIQEMSILLRNL